MSLPRTITLCNHLVLIALGHCLTMYIALFLFLISRLIYNQFSMTISCVFNGGISNARSFTAGKRKIYGTYGDCSSTQILGSSNYDFSLFFARK